MRSVMLVLFLFLLQIAWFEGFNIKNVRLDKCIRANDENNRISLTECNPDSEQQQWRWDSRLNSIVSLKTQQCLTVHKTNEFGAVKLEPCASGQPQAWMCSKRGHLTLEGFSLHLNVKHKTNKVHVSHDKGKLSKWRTFKDKIICTKTNHIWPHEGHFSLKLTIHNRNLFTT
ncbi:macrophage mannose receptor 1-like [Carcharodon carcharias]|uniref:macrophage mannose receptor 1-like n=1 Tax=Carcharodon carcharias TaxID=13397 RepID=UPI001B7E6FAD|nr:macrophage mannose receptor 1-like [Carcharodon carcharias]